jgi:hypothetical protein
MSSVISAFISWQPVQTNSSYGRWLEMRIAWGRTIVDSRILVRKAQVRSAATPFVPLRPLAVADLSLYVCSRSRLCSVSVLRYYRSFGYLRYRPGSIVQRDMSGGTVYMCRSVSLNIHILQPQSLR